MTSRRILFRSSVLPVVSINSRWRPVLSFQLADRSPVHYQRHLINSATNTKANTAKLIAEHIIVRNSAASLFIGGGVFIVGSARNLRVVAGSRCLIEVVTIEIMEDMVFVIAERN